LRGVGRRKRTGERIETFIQRYSEHSVNAHAGVTDSELKACLCQIWGTA